jgi:hypothetical protein
MGKDFEAIGAAKEHKKNFLHRATPSTSKTNIHIYPLLRKHILAYRNFQNILTSKYPYTSIDS